jgi:hypothetical protein
MSKSAKKPAKSPLSVRAAKPSQQSADAAKTSKQARAAGYCLTRRLSMVGQTILSERALQLICLYERICGFATNPYNLKDLDMPAMTGIELL